MVRLALERVIGGVAGETVAAGEAGAKARLLRVVRRCSMRRSPGQPDTGH